MKLSVNNKLIERNKKIAQTTLYVSLGLLIVGFIWTLRDTEPSKSLIGYLILIPAFLLVQISIYLANRWGKSPRPDEAVVSALKGLDNKYTLYIYTAGVPHLLVGPIGVWIINPYYHEGEISYNSEKKRYQQKGGPKIFAKYFAQEGLPNITKDVISLRKDHRKYFNNNSIHIDEEPLIVNLFISDNVKIILNDAPEINLISNKLKVFIRKFIKDTKLPTEKVEELRNKLPESD